LIVFAKPAGTNRSYYLLSLFYLHIYHDNAHLPADHKNGGGNSKNSNKKQKNSNKKAKDFVSIGGPGPDVNDPTKDNNPVKNGEPADMDHGPILIYDTRVKVSSLAVDIVQEEEVGEETIVDENTVEVMKELTWVDSP